MPCRRSRTRRRRRRKRLSRTLTDACRQSRWCSRTTTKRTTNDYEDTTEGGEDMRVTEDDYQKSPKTIVPGRVVKEQEEVDQAAKKHTKHTTGGLLGIPLSFPPIKTQGKKPAPPPKPKVVRQPELKVGREIHTTWSDDPAPRPYTSVLPRSE
ncbi:unnamed protein product [Vitrella brassicaformis CCMP3155]|uniref:Uncharacterized protein n=1 Tax=Vitrella brassicaformis (strain CCMP3155) TaxID=1169540 RepID=A0A0G4H7M6_VITBC|nr:unnamed protein product [Vitrella brassicaformis CCMP3155]|eukprot:CEM39918.1 unnamed protein product [Vitrella brassicaformis CCMP3155]